MTVLIVICVALVIGAFWFIRSSSSSPSTAISDADARLLSQAVQEQFAAKLPAWKLEPRENPLELIAVEVASGKQATIRLDRLVEVWLPLHQKGLEEQASGVIDDMVFQFASESQPESGEGDSTLDRDWVQTALTLQLFKPGQAPQEAITRAVGPLVAALVVRNLNAPMTISREDLERWHIAEDEAFQYAYANLAHEAEDSLSFDPLDESESPEAYSIARGDPLAASYALVPQTSAQIARLFEGGEPRLLLGEHALVVANTHAPDVETGPLLIEGPQPLDVVAWDKAAQV